MLRRSAVGAFLFLGVALVMATVAVVGVLAAETRLALAAIVVAAIVLVLGLRQLRIAQRIHPAVTRSSRLTLDPAAVGRAAAAGTPVPVRLGNRTVELALEAAPTDADAVIVEIAPDGVTRRPAQPVATYSGRVVGIDGSRVALSVSDQMLSALVALDDEDWWFVEPLKLFRVDANVDDYVAYRTADLRFRMDLGADTLPKEVEQQGGSGKDLPPGSAWLPPPPPPMPPPYQVGPDIGLVMVADAQYDQQATWTGWAWHQHQIAVVHNANVIYQPQLNLRLVPKVWILDKTGLTSCDASTLLGQLETSVKKAWGDLAKPAVREQKRTEIAHLTTGKELDGKTLGRAWEPGVWSLSQQQLFWIGGGGGFWGGPPNLAFQNMMLLAHEVGHNLFADHDAAEKWCKTTFPITGWCLDWVRSLMWPTYYDDNLKYITKGAKNATHDNRARIASHVAGRAGVDLTHP